MLQLQQKENQAAQKNLKSDMALHIKKAVTGTEPILLPEAKEWLRVDYTTDDALITSLITRSRELVETYTNSSIVLTTIVLEATARAVIQLPYGPIITVSSVKDIDGNDLPYEWDHFVVTLEPKSWSPTAPEAPQYVNTTTTYDAGYATVPEGLKAVLLEVLAYLYENRGDVPFPVIQNLLYQIQPLKQYRKKIWI